MHQPCLPVSQLPIPADSIQSFLLRQKLETLFLNALSCFSKIYFVRLLFKKLAEDIIIPMHHPTNVYSLDLTVKVFVNDNKDQIISNVPSPNFLCFLLP